MFFILHVNTQHTNQILSHIDSFGQVFTLGHTVKIGHADKHVFLACIFDYYWIGSFHISSGVSLFQPSPFNNVFGKDFIYFRVPRKHLSFISFDPFFVLAAFDFSPSVLKQKLLQVSFFYIILLLAILYA